MSEKKPILMKPSPSPWKAVGRLLPDGVLDYWVEDANGEEIVAIYLCDGGDEPMPFPADGNAHLIAAAPELLAALKAVREFAVHGLSWLDEHCSDRHHYDGKKALAELDAAIAKAEGREP